jgi:hypothetical protein
MSSSEKSPFVIFLKITFCGILIFAAYSIGDNLGYKRGHQETVDFTLSKLGIEKAAGNYSDYGITLDEYLEEIQSVDKSIENIFSSGKLGETAGSLVTDFINDLLGK